MKTIDTFLGHLREQLHFFSVKLLAENMEKESMRTSSLHTTPHSNRQRQPRSLHYSDGTVYGVWPRRSYQVLPRKDALKVSKDELVKILIDMETTF